MEDIRSSAELKIAIQNLEAEQAFHKQLLKDQVFLVHESLRPSNLIKNTLNDIASSPYLADNLLVTAAGLATGIVTKKIVLGLPGIIIKNLFGILLQMGVADVITHNPGSIKSLGRSIYHRIFHRNKQT